MVRQRRRDATADAEGFSRCLQIDVFRPLASTARRAYMTSKVQWSQRLRNSLEFYLAREQFWTALAGRRLLSWTTTACGDGQPTLLLVWRQAVLSVRALAPLHLLIGQALAMTSRKEATR